jgi:hypothetical protein
MDEAILLNLVVCGLSTQFIQSHLKDFPVAVVYFCRAIDLGNTGHTIAKIAKQRKGIRYRLHFN